MKKAYLLVATLFCLAAGTANAQLGLLHTFDGAHGAYPLGSLTMSGKTLFGMTNAGGANDSGCIFSVDTTGINYKDIFDFTMSKGTYPQEGSLKMAGHKLYGMTFSGGANDSGVVFSVDTDGTAFKVLLNFNGSNGAQPIGSLVLNGTKLFGMTYTGGANNYGNVFTIDTAGNNYKDLYDFTSSTGQNPYGDVTIVKDKLFGTCGAGGVGGYGTVFSIDSNGTNYTDLYDFTGIDGAYPNNILAYSGTQLFGMTYGGGANSDGNVFSMDTTGAYFTDLLDLAANVAPEGLYPQGDVVLKGHILYGMAELGGANDSGCIFSVDTNGANYTDLYDFNTGINGNSPYGDVIISGKGLYGTASAGGLSGYGILFKYNDTATTSVQPVKNIASVKLYPNPSNGLFTIQSSVGSGQSSVEVYNALGEQVYKQFTVHSSSFIVDLNNQPNGIYLYRLISETGNLVGEGKLIIQK